MNNKFYGYRYPHARLRQPPSPGPTHIVSGYVHLISSSRQDNPLGRIIALECLESGQSLQSRTPPRAKYRCDRSPVLGLREINASWSSIRNRYFLAQIFVPGY